MRFGLLDSTIGRSPADPSIDIACSIASAAHEEVILVEGYERVSEGSSKAPHPLMRVHRLHGGQRALSDARYLSLVLGSCDESLIVLTRGDRTSVPSEFCADLSESRKVPVLLLEPVHSCALR